MSIDISYRRIYCADLRLANLLQVIYYWVQQTRDDTLSRCPTRCWSPILLAKGSSIVSRLSCINLLPKKMWIWNLGDKEWRGALLFAPMNIVSCKTDIEPL